MKRGLVLLDPAEVPETEWQERVAGLQQRLAEQRIDVALVYGDVFSSDDIAYLTNLCVYWNEGVLAVPAAAQPVFLTKLSPRVHPWMKRVSTVTRIESGREFGALVAKLLADRPPGTLGLVDAALWPASVVEDIGAALPDWELRQLTGLVREQRTVPSSSELALLRQGAEVVGRAVDEAVGEAAGEAAGGGGSGGGGEDPGGTFERVAAVERIVRGAGFLDVQVSTAATADGAECVQATGQYRTGWLHASRLAKAAGLGWAAALQEALDAAVSAAAAGASGDALAGAAAPALSRLPEGANARVSWVNQTDLASGGEYRTHPGDAPLVAGSVVAVTVDALFADGGYAALADTVQITADGARNLTRRSAT